MKYIAVDSACGPGGFSEGWAIVTGRRDNILGVDFNETARRSYEAAGFTAIHGDLFDTEDYVRRVLEANGGERPRVVIGSSSCKGWTPAGRGKGVEDERDTLLEWCLVTGKLQPEVAIMENVPRAKRHPDWPKALTAIGLPLVAEWTLKAYLYGAPTSRTRTFWVWRRDGRWPLKPLPTPVPCEFSSVISFHGRTRSDGVVCYLSAPASGAEGLTKARTRDLTHEEALIAQGAPSKIIVGAAFERAQQIADMIPPPLAAAVIRAALKGTGILEEVERSPA